MASKFEHIPILNGFVSTLPVPTQVQVEYTWIGAQAELQTLIKTIPGPIDAIQDVPWVSHDRLTLQPVEFIRGVNGACMVMCVALNSTSSLNLLDTGADESSFLKLFSEEVPLDETPTSPQDSTGSFDNSIESIGYGQDPLDHRFEAIQDSDFGSAFQFLQTDRAYAANGKPDWKNFQVAAQQDERSGNTVSALENYSLCLQALGDSQGRAVQTQIEVMERMGLLYQSIQWNDKALEFYGKAMSLKQKTKLFPCPECPYTACHKGNLVFHVRTHTGEKPFKCPHCTYAASRRCHLNIHLRTHSGDKPFSCDLCDYAAKTKSQLQGHTRTHTRETPFKCPVCPYAASQQGTLSRHVHRKHPNPNCAV